MLPADYDPLLLSFHDPRVVAGATVIGTDGSTQFRLVESAVVSGDSAAELPERFVNSSVDCLASCIAAHRKYCCDIDVANSENEELAAVDSFAATIRQIDPECLSNPENWWTVIVQQMRDGQL